MNGEVVLSVGDIVWRVGLALFLVLSNGFFVAAEFSLVGARRTRLDSLANAGNRRAKVALGAIHHLDHYISGTQLGITVSSLGLGWVGEATIATILIQLFDGLPAPWDVVASHAVAGTIAFGLITFLHIVLGELAPKSLALLFPEGTSMWSAGPLIVFSKLLRPFILVLNGSANLLLRTLGLRTPTAAERVHHPQEIRMLVAQTREHGLLEGEPAEMIHGVFDLSETVAEEVMTPRPDVTALAETAEVSEAVEVMLQSGHFRLPVYRDSVDSVVGVVVARDVWKADRKGSSELAGLIRPVAFVPESKPVQQLLLEMQRERVHLAVVVDEYGGTAGIVTIEDLVEEVVGEIRDEHEEELPEIEEASSGEILLDGAAPLSEVNDRLGLSIPEEDHNTVAGFVMHKLGRIAREGDRVEFPGGRLRVLEMSGRRIGRLRLDAEKTPTRMATSTSDEES
ncbi:MAG: hemolysin family protein [Longimicrobiaceae bacterium]